MATLYETVRADIVTAMKARDTTTTTAVRTLDAAFTRRHVEHQLVIDPTHAMHNETAWAARFGAAAEFVLGPADR